MAIEQANNQRENQLSTVDSCLIESAFLRLGAILAEIAQGSCQPHEGSTPRGQNDAYSYKREKPWRAKLGLVVRTRKMAG